jgi:hypothetical protein
MILDLLDEYYPIVKSKLPFEDFDQSGLTGYAIPVRPAYRDMPILGVNTIVRVHISVGELYKDRGLNELPSVKK